MLQQDNGSSPENSSGRLNIYPNRGADRQSVPRFLAFKEGLWCWERANNLLVRSTKKTFKNHMTFYDQRVAETEDFL